MKSIHALTANAIRGFGYPVLRMDVNIFQDFQNDLWSVKEDQLAHCMTMELHSWQILTL